MDGSSSSGNPREASHIDWSYDSVSEAPNFLSFENNSTQPNRGRYNSGNSHHNSGSPRGRGGPGFEGPPRYHYNNRPRGGGYFPRSQPYQYGPPAHFRGQRFNNHNNNRGFYRGGNSPRRGGRFNGRARGGFGHGNQSNADVPISAYFHPSMLEDPWAPRDASRGLNTVAKTEQTPQVTVPDDDPELLELCGQMRANAAAAEKKVMDTSETGVAECTEEPVEAAPAEEKSEDVMAGDENKLAAPAGTI